MASTTKASRGLTGSAKEKHTMVTALFIIVILGGYIGFKHIRHLERLLEEEQIKVLEKTFKAYNGRVTALEIKVRELSNSANYNPMLSDIGLQSIVDEAVPSIVDAIEQRFKTYNARIKDLEAQLADLAGWVEK